MDTTKLSCVHCKSHDLLKPSLIQIRCALFGMCPFWNVLFLEFALLGMFSFWNLPFFEYALFGMSPFLEWALFGMCSIWNVPFLECSQFRMCLFWNVLYLECALYVPVHSDVHSFYIWLYQPIEVVFSRDNFPGTCCIRSAAHFLEVWLLSSCTLGQSCLRPGGRFSKQVKQVYRD